MGILLAMGDDLEARLIAYLIVESGVDRQVSIARSPEEASQLLQEQGWSALLLDESPDSGPDLLRRLVASRFDGSIIVLGSSSNVMDKVRVLESGADEYIARPYEPAELLARLRVALRRSWRRAGQAESSVVRAGALQLDLHAMTVSLPGSRQQRLTRNEMRLLHYLMTNAQRVVNHQELLAQIFGTGGQQVPSNAVGVYMCRIRQKVEPNPERPRYLVTVRGRGYQLLSGGAASG
jgi:two-component system, OmpR family, KDP operon response regulator KdpE